MIKDANKNIEDYAYFNRYDEDQYNAYLNSKVNGNQFTLNLPVGDQTILRNLPDLIKDIPINDLPKMQKLTIFNAKRKRVCLADVNVTPNVPTTEPIEPPTKKARLDRNITELDQKFTLFVNKLQENLRFSITTQVEGDPIFAIDCPKCGKSVKIGFKISKCGNPSFVKTNWKVHSCNKTATENPESQISVNESIYLEE